jgi:hypothetical protein
MAGLEEFLAGLEGRLNIHTVQQILRVNNLLSARSWSELHMIIKGAVAKSPLILEKLKEALQMQQICDLKAVSYFVVGPEHADDIHRNIRDLKPQSSPMEKAFPLSVGEDELAKDNGELKIIKVFSDDTGTGLILSRKRRFTLSNDILRDNFSQELRDQFPEAEKLIEVKAYDRQTFDIIYFNRVKSIIELRADMTRDTGMPQTAGQLKKSIDDLKFFSRRLLATYAKNFTLGTPFNLLPLAKGVYADMSGAIKRIGFATETESVKRETMKAGVDLRSELFHKTGAKAIDHKMSIFEVAMQWHRMDIDKVDSKPELHIPGSYRDYVQIGARTDYAFVKGMRTYDDSNFVLDKIISYIP